MGNCAGIKPKGGKQPFVKGRRPLTKTTVTKLELMTPMGPDVADMAYRQDTEF